MLYPLLKRYKNTPYHFCYITNQMIEDARKLEESGYILIQKPLPAPCIQDGTVVFLQHPEIGIIELVEFRGDLV